MKPTLSDFVLVENVFTEEFCKKAINILEMNEWQTHGWYGKSPTGGKVITMEGSDFAVNHHMGLQNLMIPYVKQFLEVYVSKINKNNPWLYGCGNYKDDQPERLVEQYSGIRFNRYDEGKLIKKHIDHIHSIFDGDRKGIPVLSLVGVFNDDYEGGEFVMWDDTVIPLKTGDIVAFPSVFMYQHQVKPVTKGSRYSWVQWTF